MSGSIYMAASGALAYEKRLQIISNNLANTNTVGYKMDHSQFRVFDLADGATPTFEEPPALNTSQAPLFWMQFDMYTDYSSGSLRSTGNDLDLALVGDGFFCVQTSDGVAYTRKGSFTLNSEGTLVTQDGLPVLGEGGEITLKGQQNPQKYKKFGVDEQGNISVDGKSVDSLRIVDFARPYNLTKIGDTLFKPATADTGEIKVENIKVSQGFIEQSNVDAVKMMTEMIEVLRGYETYQKVIKSVDDANSKAINEVGRTT
jgi:flagellar basal-body rod protein FlgF